MLDIVLDLEAMGKTPDIAIVGIGAVEFDLSAGLIGDTFYRAVNLADAVRKGCTMDAGTVAWWLSQTKDAQNAVTFSTYPLVAALNEFSAFVDRCGPRNQVRVWGKGPIFDNAMLEHAYWLCEMEAPWKHCNSRCVRTIMALYSHVEPDEFVGQKHNAIDDAMHEARHLVKIRNSVRQKVSA